MLLLFHRHRQPAVSLGKGPCYTSTKPFWSLSKPDLPYTRWFSLSFSDIHRHDRSSMPWLLIVVDFHREDNSLFSNYPAHTYPICFPFLACAAKHITKQAEVCEEARLRLRQGWVWQPGLLDFSLFVEFVPSEGWLWWRYRGGGAVGPSLIQFDVPRSRWCMECCCAVCFFF